MCQLVYMCQIYFNKRNINKEKNNWFTSEEPIYDINIKSTSEINSAINKIKTNSSSMIKYQGVQELVLPTSATSCYDDGDDDADQLNH